MPCTCRDKVQDTLPCSWERGWCQCHHNHRDTARFLLHLHPAERSRQAHAGVYSVSISSLPLPCTRQRSISFSVLEASLKGS